MFYGNICDITCTLYLMLIYAVLFCLIIIVSFKIIKKVLVKVISIIIVISIFKLNFTCSNNGKSN